MTENPRDIIAALQAGEVLNPECVCPRCGSPKAHVSRHCEACAQFMAAEARP